MVHNTLIKCDVCEAITRIRLQVGWLDSHPIAVTCRNCGITLSGEVMINQDKIRVDYHFSNAKILKYTDYKDDDEIIYTVECSGELPTIKDYSNYYGNGIDTPFIRNISRFESFNKYNIFCQNVNTILETSKKWSSISRVFELYKNNKVDYIKKEISFLLPQELCSFKDELELLRAMHLMEIHYFIKPLRNDLLNDKNLGKEIMCLNNDQIKKLTKYLNDYKGYTLFNMQNNIYDVMREFIKTFQFLIPAYSLQFYKEEVDFEKEGTTASTYSDVSEFYKNTYEKLGDLLLIPVCLNNIKYRGDYNQLNPSIDKGGTIDDFIGMLGTG